MRNRSKRAQTAFGNRLRAKHRGNMRHRALFWLPAHRAKYLAQTRRISAKSRKFAPNRTTNINRLRQCAPTMRPEMLISRRCKYCRVRAAAQTVCAIMSTPAKTNPIPPTARRLASCYMIRDIPVRARAGNYYMPPTAMHAAKAMRAIPSGRGASTVRLAAGKRAAARKIRSAGGDFCAVCPDGIRNSPMTAIIVTIRTKRNIIGSCQLR